MFTGFMGLYTSGSAENNYRSAGNDCESGFSAPENRNTEFQTENNDNFTTASSSLLSSPRMVHNPFAVKVETPTRSMADSTDHKEFRPILAPATLVLGRCVVETETVMNSVSSSFRLKPPILNNPFLKVDAAALGDKKLETSEVSTTSDNVESMYPDTGQESESTSSVAVRAAEGALRKTSLVVPPSLSRLATQQLEESEKQVDENMPPATNQEMPSPSNLTANATQQPQRSTFSPGAGTSSAGQDGGFVFGQNMDERVVNAKSRQCVVNGTAGLFSKQIDSGDEDEDGLFRNATVPSNFSEPQNDEDFDSVAVERQIKSLTESAQEYEARQVKRTYEEVAIITGEEGESNVLQMNCRLFVFEKTDSSWIEKGRCLLRLNDKENTSGNIHSRLVARAHGNLRLMLNTKIWAAMSVDRPSSTSVRFSAWHEGLLLVCLVLGSTKDIDLLFGALDWRITTLKSCEDRRSTDGCLSTSIGSSCGGTLADETISSSASASSPASSPLVEMASTSAVAATSENCYNVSTSVTFETPIGTKKRRISPPSEDNVSVDNHCEELQLENSQVQERIVDSTDNNDSNSADSKLI